MRALPLTTRKQLLSASGLALATALVAYAPGALAQSFQATPTSTFGSVTINTGSGTTDIVVSSPSAVINWTPTDTAATGGPIIFQTAGTTATFTNNPASNSDFTVLNRIIPSGSTRPVQFDGTVVSRLQSAAGGQSAGGTVFFYSPGGILIGATSVFDVGNLVLTTSDLNYNTTNGSFDSNGSYVFQPATVAGSQIVVSAGAQLGATTDGSYIAMVAPSVTNNGTITVNGSAALVAADAATITFSPSGLFDIQVDSGTSATGTVATNNGTITGPAASNSSFFHRIYMVAVPKNDAITMAIGAGSSLGFDVAGAADVVGNAVVLSAGRDISGGVVSPAASPGGGTGLASVIGGDGDITSDFTARATGSVNLGSGTSAGLDFASNVFIQATGGDSGLFANSTGSVNVAGNVEIYGDVSGTSPSTLAIGNRTQLYATDGGVINVTGDVHLSSNAYGASSATPDTSAGDALGSFAKIQANNGGRVSVGGDVQLDAIGFGGQAQTTGTGAGRGTGGVAWVLSTGTGNSLVDIGGSLVLDATGRGYQGLGCFTCATDGGSAEGGLAAIRANGSNTIQVGADTSMTADALAGNSNNLIAGSATGGSISVFAINGATVQLNGLFSGANGIGGDGGANGGTGLGGTISVSSSATGSSLTINGLADFRADGIGGAGLSPGGASGAATGGSISVFADGSDLSITGDLSAQANGSASVTYGAAAPALGGHVGLASANGGLVSISGNTALVSNGLGVLGAGSVSSGAGTGGDVSVFVGGGTIEASGQLFMTANGSGGDNFNNTNAGVGAGGTAIVTVNAGGNLSVGGNIAIAATGRGGSASDGTGNGGQGAGGLARILMATGQLAGAGSLSLVAEGFGGDGTVAGSGIGGEVSLNLQDANYTIDGVSYIGAVGSGGSDVSFSSNGAGGAAIAGSIVVTANNSIAHLSQTGDATFEVTGYAGLGHTAAHGRGGIIQFSANSSTVDAFNSLNLFAEGVGSLGIAGGNGGLGIGGDISLVAGAAVTATTRITAPTLQISATGRGGDGAISSASDVASGSGGNAQGGSITLLTAPDGGVISSGQLLASATAVAGSGAVGIMGLSTGGEGGAGGTATGGTINIGALTPAGGTGTGGYDFGFASVSVLAQGGNGGDGGEGFAVGPGGNGGGATGGSVVVFLDQAGSSFAASDGVNIIGDAYGGNSGNCGIPCTAVGGNAQGGALSLGAGGASSGRNIAIGGTLTMSSLGFGGGSYGVVGGSGTGGTVLVRLDSGMAFDAGQVELYASARGGDDFTSGTGGSAQGGSASFIASGTSSATISGAVNIYSDSVGGAGRDVGANGGAAVGGTSRLYSDGGAISIVGGVTIDAGGFGGTGYLNGPSGIGGAGTGGTALLTVGTPDAIGNNGSIEVGGFSFVTADGTGGDSAQGGVGTGGFVGISARQGTLALDQVISTATGSGGYGQFGGDGGAATGGIMEIVANSATEGAGLFGINSLFADVSAYGGQGGDAGVPGGNGGAGGLGDAGSLIVLGSAVNGRLSVGSVSAQAVGQGGNGGSGGTGGAGGEGLGGSLQIGTASFSGIEAGGTYTGSGTFGSVLGVAAGVGGNGGGGDASAGTGGAGGNGTAGGVTLLARGSQVTITGSGSFNAHAQGGDGGSGATVGVGGNASVGNTTNPDLISGVSLLVTNRFQQPTVRGSLTAGDLSFSALAIGGNGSVNGTSTIAGDAVDMQLINSSFTGTNVSFVAQADGVAAQALPEFITLTNSTADLSGGLFFTTPGAFSLTLDQSALTANHVSISASNWVFGATAPTTVGTLTGTSSLSLSSGQDLVGYANLSTQGSLDLFALGRINLGSLFALGAIDVTAGSSLTLGDATAGDSIDLLSQAVMATGNLTAGTSITLQSAGNVNTGNLAAGSGTPNGANGDLYSIGITSGGNVLTGNIAAASNLGIAAAGTLNTGNVSAFDTLLLAHGNIVINSLNVVNRALVADSAMAALGQTPNGFDKELVFAAEPVATGGTVTITNASGAGSLAIAAGSTLTAGNISVATTVQLASGGAASLGQVTAGLGTPTATGSGLVSIVSGGDLTAGNLTSSGDVRIAANGGLNLGTVVGYDVLLGATTNVAIAGLNVRNRTLVANSSMRALGETANGFDKELVFAATPVATGGSVSIANQSTFGTLRIAAGTTVTAGNLIAGGRIGVTSTGSMSFGNLQGQTDRIELISRNGSISAGSLVSGSDILASGATGLSLGTVRGRDVALLSAGNIAVQAALAGIVVDPATGQITNAVGRLLIANSSMLPASSQPGSISYTGLFGATPVRSGGSATISGGAIASRIIASSSGNFSGGGLRGFAGIEVESGGLVTVAQRWLAPDVRIVSGDISIIDNGNATGATGQPILSGIRTTETGTVNLISLSENTALIGDGLTGSGYALSNAEIGLISTSELLIAASDQANATDMLIGNLSLAAGGAIGSTNAAGTAGKIIFASGNLQTETPGGAIRVVGNISGTGFGQGNILEFTTGRFELDAATGSINLTSAAQASTTAPLGGIVEFNADNIHVAAGSILDKLAANPLYDGRIAELNAPAAVQRPDGVLRALGLDFYPTGTLYIQNTGTALNPAGFFADADLVDVTPPTSASPGTVSLVVNGAFQTATGVATGAAAHDLVVNAPDADFTPFTADSQINGCALSATTCSSAMEGPDPVGAISSQIEIISNQTLSTTPSFVEDPGAPSSDDDGSTDDPLQPQQEEQGEGEQAASSPIAPPPQLIDSRPLEPQSQIEQPVAGSGNPALIGSVVNENSAEGDAQ